MHKGKKRLSVDIDSERNEKKRFEPLPLETVKYAGQDELESYINTTKKPRFTQFVSQNKDNIVNWCSDKNTFDEMQLSALWKQRFALSFRLSEKEMNRETLKTTKADKEIWVSIKKMLDTKENLRDRFTLAGINTLANMSETVEPSQAEYNQTAEEHRRYIRSFVDADANSFTSDTEFDVNIATTGTQSDSNISPTGTESDANIATTDTESDANIATTGIEFDANVATTGIEFDANIVTTGTYSGDPIVSNQAPDTNDATCFTNTTMYFHEAHRIAYVKLNNGTVKNEDYDFINKLRDNSPPNIITSLVSIGTKYLNNVTISSYEANIIMLSISGIVNLLNTDMINTYKNLLTEEQWKYITDEEKTINLNEYPGLDDDSSKKLDDLLDLENVDDILAYVDEQKYLLSKKKEFKKQAYVMLLIVDQIVRNFKRWSKSKNESELTIYRRFAALFDILLDGTSIEMIDGEKASEATKASIDMNKSVFGLGESSSTYGRKIDLMLGLNSDRKKSIEISSNEWKRGLVSQDIVEKQQCKNLRTNACIIQQLADKYKVNTPIIAMDFIGNYGCLYMMKKTKEEIIISKPIARLSIPYHSHHLNVLKSTLNSLFQMKSFLVKQSRLIDDAIYDSDFNNTIPSLNLPNFSTTAHATETPAPYIFWETKFKN